MLTFVLWRWDDPGIGYRLPKVCPYTHDHIRKLLSMVSRHYKAPHRFVIFDERPADVAWALGVYKAGFPHDVTCLQVPDVHAELGGCYRRLWLFSTAAELYLGKRFVSIDLDCVITGDITELLQRPEALVLNSYNALPSDPRPYDQHYNGSLILHTAGAQPELWKDFQPRVALKALELAHASRVCIGSDQAWLRLKLGKWVPRFTNADGVYEARQVERGLPANAKIVFFSGRRDPTTWKHVPWVQEHYR